MGIRIIALFYDKNKDKKILTKYILCHKINMKEIKWNEEKNKRLLKERKVCFEDFVDAIKKKEYLEETNNKNYPRQRKFFMERRGYVYIIPYVKNDAGIFLKTIIPSRKATKKYLKKKGIIL